MTLRAVVWRSSLCRFMEGRWRSSASSLRYFGESKGRMFSEEERAKETVIQKMERERMEKLRKKKAEQEKADKDMKAEELGPHKS